MAEHVGTCASCCYFNASEGQPFGQCMLRPPVVFVLEKRGPFTLRPDTCEDDWCGEWVEVAHDDE